FGGQPVVSWADVQWVLYTASDTDPVKVEVDRDGKKIETSIVLPPGWRTR
ncbi:MAG: peptidase, partial [Planctomycetes bacterium]|nr:peptidase [Planctomycetota bacterium]